MKNKRDVFLVQTLVGRMVACKYLLWKLEGEETLKKNIRQRKNRRFVEKKKIIVIGGFEKCLITKT
jgi:hypothetical protein